MFSGCRVSDKENRKEEMCEWFLCERDSSRKMITATIFISVRIRNVHTFQQHLKTECICVRIFEIGNHLNERHTLQFANICYAVVMLLHSSTG